MNPPLRGIRVLDLSRILAGPFCSMTLADLGAEVLKVEMPIKGDDARAWGPPFVEGEAPYFLSINRNKKSITIDLKTQKGREILLELARRSDVFLENFRPGVTKRLGIDYQSIFKVNPRIIYCSISSFGQTGPYRDRLAYDLVIQGMGGFMGITGEPNRPPVRVGVAISDIAAGMYGAIAILSAIISREKTNKGEKIDLALLDGTVSWMTYMAANYFATCKAPKKMGSAHPNIVPYQCFRANDGRYFTLAVGNDRIWRDFCKALCLDELFNEERFSTNSGRVRNREELINTLENIFDKKARDEWLSILIKNDVPCGPVYLMDEIFHDPQIRHREMLVEIEHPKAGKIKQIGIPVKLGNSPLGIKTSAPLLGEHTGEVLQNILELSSADIDKLRKERII